MQMQKQLRILVAEDDAVTRFIVQRMIGFLGHEALVAADGEQALDEISAIHPDMIVLDINMPGKNGYEVANIIYNQHLQRGELCPTFILTSAMPMPEYERPKPEWVKKGLFHFIQKPFTVEKLQYIFNQQRTAIAS